MYRDLKLQNVLMDDYGNVSLTDFGMARVIRDGQLANTFCGTPEYLAPEVLVGGGYGKEADWWSLGILAYQMMFGLPPFYNKSQSTMFKLIKQADIKFSQKVNLSAEGKDFILKILNKNPKDRLGSKKDFEQLFEHPWLKSIDREKMFKKQLPTPYKPKVQGDDWIQGFDKEFTSQKAIYDQRQDAKQSEQYKKIFNQF